MASSIPQLILKILEKKGVSSEQEALSFLSPQLKDLTHPQALLGMDRAVERLVQAFKNQEWIAVYGDFDLDGTSGAALLVEGFETLGFRRPYVYQPQRLTEGYGFHAHAVEKIKGLGCDLIVTVDVGITAIEACHRARDLNLDVIITDHHQPQEELPQALAILNPNQPDCTSNLGHLAGTGVGYYLLLGVSSALKQRGLIASDVSLKSLLDFFAIGTVTDMVPLIGENRVLVKHGLKILSQTPRPGLRALLEELDLYGENLTSFDLAMKFAPKLNALSRLEASIRPIDLYLEKDAQKAQELCSETIEVNKARVAMQKAAESLAQELVRDQEGAPFLWVYSEKFHKGVIGLVATRLAQKYGVPTYVGAVMGDKIAGSARAGADGQSVLGALEFASWALAAHGGHHQAAGFEVPLAQESDFAQAMAQYFAQPAIEPAPLVTDLGADWISVNLSEINSGFMNWYGALEPFGVGFEAPIFLAQGVRVTAARELSGGHLKLSFEQDIKGHILEAIWFSPQMISEDRDRLLNREGLFDIVFQVQWNRFAGRRLLQLQLENVIPFRVAVTEVDKRATPPDAGELGRHENP